MAKLTTSERKKLPKGDFALPGRRYPVEDKSHAANAKARASAAGREGKLTKSQERRVDAAADRVLRGGKKSGR